MTKQRFTLLIPTKNRLTELTFTLKKLQFLLENPFVDCIICDDGSSDGTSKYLTENYPNVKVVRNRSSKGIHAVRNKLLSLVNTPFVISIDDDAHFITEDVLKNIEEYFNKNERIGLISFRAFWSLNEPLLTNTSDEAVRVKSFGAVGFAMRTKAWNEISNLLEWFKFYGEEDFIAFQLFKKDWEIHYLPEVLVHHRVNIKSRKKDKDYRLRLRRSLRSGWYLYFLFYPVKEIPRKFLYTLWMQLKLKVFKGDFKALIAIIQALFDVILNIPRLYKNSNRLTKKEFDEFQKIADAKIYWKP